MDTKISFACGEKSNKLMYYHLKTRRCVKVKPLLIYCYSMYYNSFNDITNKSREQRLITKEHIATHVNLILLFKPALYSSYFSDKTF